MNSAWQAWHLWHWVGSGSALGSRWRRSLCVAGVALGDLCGLALAGIDLNCVRQAWHLVTSTCHLRGKRGTYGTGSQAPRGRRGTWWHRRAICVAGVALSDIDVHSAWRGHWCHTQFASQAWHLWHWVGSGAALGSRWRRSNLCGRRGTWHRRAICVAGVALMALGWLLPA